MCYEEQVLDYWSKIVLDQREFREKLLKAGNRTLFPDTVSILNKLSERKVDLGAQSFVLTWPEGL